MEQSLFRKADICLPKKADMTLWSVVACDQYTSEPAYWDEVERIVGDAPSTLRLTLPELYLGQPDVGERIAAICGTMRDYLAAGVLEEHKDCCIYVERALANGRMRRGLVGVLDLEYYDFNPGSVSPLRATEGTVLDRIPPRLAVRRDAELELPHVMVLIDDPDKTVIEPLGAQTDELRPAYDFPLMQNGGSVRGWFVRGGAFDRTDHALGALADPALLAGKYPAHNRGELLFAVGDGNHSLATAKTNFEQLKTSVSEEIWKNHPARYALVELVNVHDPALEFEPIHRVLFDVEPEKVLEGLRKAFDISDAPCAGQHIRWSHGTRRGELWIKNPASNLAVGTLQSFCDEYLHANGGRIDYIHGDEVAAELAAQPDRIAFLLPPMQKSELFPTVLLDGVLPRKTFSMGHARDKRYYLEARRVRPDTSAE